jgi:hypothetical protein
MLAHAHGGGFGTARRQRRRSENPYNGKWTVSFDGKKSAELDGSVVIKENGELRADTGGLRGFNVYVQKS